MVKYVLRVYRDRYFDLNMRNFHEKLSEEHGIELSYTWVKLALQGAGPGQGAQAGLLPGMLLHQTAARHPWFQEERWNDLIVILDDATSEIYYAQLVEEESTVTVMAGSRRAQMAVLRLYSDGQLFLGDTEGRRQGGPHRRPKWVGRSANWISKWFRPTRRRREDARNASSAPGRALAAGIATARNPDLRASQPAPASGYIGEFNRRFSRGASTVSGSAFVPLRGRTPRAHFLAATHGRSTATTLCNLKICACRSSRSSGAAFWPVARYGASTSGPDFEPLLRTSPARELHSPRQGNRNSSKSKDKRQGEQERPRPNSRLSELIQS